MSENMEIGEHYHFKYGMDPEAEALVYVGKNWSGNGFWHQFELLHKRGEVWAELLDSDLWMIQKSTTEDKKEQS